MQRVTYTNLLGESLVFSNEAPMLLRSVSGLGRTNGTITRSQGAGLAGETFLGVEMASRSIRVAFDIFGAANRERLYRQRMRIESVLSPQCCWSDGRMGRIRYENDAGCWEADALPDGEITYGTRFRDAVPSCSARFLCEDAYLMAAQADSTALYMGHAGFTLPTKLPVRLGTRKFHEVLYNSGTVDTPVEIIIYGTGENPQLVNYTTGANITISRAISTGDKLLINTAPRSLSCQIAHADGTLEDAYGYLAPTVAVSAFVLVPGLNDIEYVPSVPSGASRVELTWHARMSGV